MIPLFDWLGLVARAGALVATVVVALAFMGLLHG